MGANNGGTSIALDSNDKIHISFRHTSLKDLMYATDKSGSWVISTIDSIGDMGKSNSIVIDSSDKVHISYYDNSDEDLKYATDKSGSWTYSTLESRALIYTSLSIDDNDAAHIAYYDSTNQDLRYIGFDSNANIYGYSISPDITDGLNFNTSTGEISGTPTLVLTRTMYTITAKNYGGTSTTYVNITVNDASPSISYPQNDLTLTKGNGMGTVSPTNNGGAADSWAISPSFSNGLNFDTSTGEITGTPNLIQTRTCLLYTSPSPRDRTRSRMPSSA